MSKLEGELDATGVKIGIVISRFNSMVTDKLLSGAKDKLTRLGGDWDEVTVAYVPGSFELPRAASKMAESGDYDGIVALGAIIRGETPHFEYVANESSKGLAQLNRAGAKQGNKGSEAAEAAVEMINLEAKMTEEG